VQFYEFRKCKSLVLRDVLPFDITVALDGFVTTYLFKALMFETMWVLSMIP